MEPRTRRQRINHDYKKLTLGKAVLGWWRIFVVAISLVEMVQCYQPLARPSFARVSNNESGKANIREAWQSLRARGGILMERVATRLFRNDTVAATKSILKIIEAVDDHGVIDVFQKHPPHELLSAIYALSRLQAACEVYDRSFSDTPHRTDTPVCKELIDELRHYAPFAAATYGWKLELATTGRMHGSDLQALVKMTKVDPNDVVKVVWESRPNRPAFYIVRDRPRKRVVLAVRGTWSAHDILTDLCCTHEEYDVSWRQHKAHSGMLAAAQAVGKLAEDIIAKELQENPGYSLLLVGHSLGASVAAVLGQLWEDKFPDLKVYTYGAGCVVPQGDMSGDRVTSVLSEGDPISTLSLGHVADISVAVSHLCNETDLRSTIFNRTSGAAKAWDKDTLQWCHDTMEDIRLLMPGDKLYPPGRLLLVHRPRKRKGVYEVDEVSTSFFRDIKIEPRMFDLSRHVPQLYVDRLRKAVPGSQGNSTSGEGLWRQIARRLGRILGDQGI